MFTYNLTERFDTESGSSPSHIASAPTSRFAEESLLLTSTAQPRGGQRWWFFCPSCKRRVGVLFFVGQQWDCQRCASVIYTSSLRSDKRLRPLIRAISRSWQEATLDAATQPDAYLEPLPETSSLANGRLSLHVTSSLKLLLNASALALRRLERGVPLCRERRRL
jgi:hypothetical protein